MKPLILFLALAVLSSCGKKKEDIQPVQEAVTLKDIPADPPTIDDKGVFGGQTGKYYLLDIKTGKKVSNDDQNTNKWHFGFRLTETRNVNIITNGGTSGPGGCAAQIVDGVFDNYKSPPADGYLTDNGTNLAIPNTVVSSNWVDYNSSTHIITPTAGRIIVLKTGEGRYAKMEVISFYKGAPSSPTRQSPPGYFTVRYAHFN